MSKITLNDYYFDINNKIGKGSSGVVFSGYHVKTKDKVAIKRVDINDLNKNNKFGKNMKINKIWNEIEIMKELDHPNIIKLYDVYIDIKNEYLYLIMEFCDGGDLSDYINDYTLDLTQVKEFITALKNGLEYLHNRGVVHRDLKPHNLLIKNVQNKLIIKIADFGLSAFNQDGGLMQTMCGSPLYMSPEIIEHQKYTAKSDLWSIGIIIYQLIYHRHPYENCKNYAELVKLVKTEPIKYPSKPPVDNLTIDLLQGLLDKNCHNRISWEDFFKHPWFKHPFGTAVSESNHLVTSRSSSKQIPIKQTTNRTPSTISKSPSTTSRSPITVSSYSPVLPSSPISPPSQLSALLRKSTINDSMDMDLMFENDQVVDEEADRVDLSLYLVENYNRTNNKATRDSRSITTKEQKTNNTRYERSDSNKINRINKMNSIDNANSTSKVNDITKTDSAEPGDLPSKSPSRHRPSSNKPIIKHHHNVKQIHDIYGTSAPEQKRMMEYSPSSLTFSSMGTSILEYVSTSYDWIKSSIEF
jgi:serine/threonine protein kinase